MTSEASRALRLATVVALGACTDEPILEVRVDTEGPAAAIVVGELALYARRSGAPERRILERAFFERTFFPAVAYLLPGEPEYYGAVELRAELVPASGRASTAMTTGTLERGRHTYAALTFGAFRAEAGVVVLDGGGPDGAPPESGADAHAAVDGRDGPPDTGEAPDTGDVLDSGRPPVDAGDGCLGTDWSYAFAANVAYSPSADFVSSAWYGVESDGATVGALVRSADGQTWAPLAPPTSALFVGGAAALGSLVVFVRDGPAPAVYRVDADGGGTLFDTNGSATSNVVFCGDSVWLGTRPPGAPVIRYGPGAANVATAESATQLACDGEPGRVLFLDSAGQVSWFSASPPGSVQPILNANGVHCVAASQRGDVVFGRTQGATTDFVIVERDDAFAYVHTERTAASPHGPPTRCAIVERGACTDLYATFPGAPMAGTYRRRLP